ncbi:unnamed protein product [Gadus morhua 'NCC']
MVTREGAELQPAVLQLVQQIVRAAQEHVREKRYSAEVDDGACEKENLPEFGEGRDTGGLVPGRSLVLAALELCLHVLLRKIPRLSPALTGTPAAGGPGGPGGPLVLSDEDWLLVASALDILSHLPSICSPEGSVSVLPSLLFLLLGVLRELLLQPNINTAPQQRALQALQGVVSSPLGRQEKSRGGWTLLLGAALNTVLDTWGNAVDQGAVDQVGVLRVLTVFLVSAGPEVVLVQPVLGSCLRRYTRALHSKDPLVVSVCLQMLTTVFQTQSGVAAPYIRTLGPPLLRYLQGAERRRPQTPGELQGVLEALRAMEALVSASDPTNRPQLMAVFLPILISFLMDENALGSAPSASRALHESALKDLMRLGPQSPSVFRSLMSSSPQLKARLQAAIQGNQESLNAKASAAANRTSKTSPSITLKTNFLTKTQDRRTTCPSSPGDCDFFLSATPPLHPAGWMCPKQQQPPAIMADVDPDTLLEWLQMGQGDERDMQLIALEQLCMLLLMSDNVDRCFETCPPRTFLPALCKIFLDESAPDNVLEVTARAITYYLDVSAECTRRIVGVDGAIKALCNRLVVELNNRTSRDLAEQCVKVLELICTRESGAVFEAGGLNCVLTFIRDSGHLVHKDTLHSAMAVVSRLCSKMEPQDSSLETCVESLSSLLKHQDHQVSDGALRCFASLADRFTRRGVDPAPLAKHGLTEELLSRMAAAGGVATGPASSCKPGRTSTGGAPPGPDAKLSNQVSTIVSLLSTLCRGSPLVTHDLLRSALPDSMQAALGGDERCVLDTMRLVDLLLVLLFEGRKALPKSTAGSTGRIPGLRRLDSSGERSHRQLIDCIRSKDTDALIDAIDTGAFEVNFMDDVGQTLLNWASAFGTQEMVEFLCERGADVNRGQRSSSLHYAACFGRPQVAKTLLRHGANPDLRDEDWEDSARQGQRERTQGLDVSGEQERGEEEAGAEQGGGGERGAQRDPEMAPLYLKRLLPVFATTFQQTMLPSIRKASLALIRKMVHYSSELLLKEDGVHTLYIHNLPTVLVEITATVLDQEVRSPAEVTR